MITNEPRFDNYVTMAKGYSDTHKDNEQFLFILPQYHFPVSHKSFFCDIENDTVMT